MRAARAPSASCEPTAPRQRHANRPRPASVMRTDRAPPASCVPAAPARFYVNHTLGGRALSGQLIVRSVAPLGGRQAAALRGDRPALHAVRGRDLDLDLAL